MEHKVVDKLAGWCMTQPNFWVSTHLDLNPFKPNLINHVGSLINTPSCSYIFTDNWEQNQLFKAFSITS